MNKNRLGTAWMDYKSTLTLVMNLFIIFIAINISIRTFSVNTKRWNKLLAWARNIAYNFLLSANLDEPPSVTWHNTCKVITQRHVSLVQTPTDSQWASRSLDMYVRCSLISRTFGLFFGWYQNTLHLTLKHRGEPVKSLMLRFWGWNTGTASQNAARGIGFGGGEVKKVVQESGKETAYISRCIYSLSSEME